MSAYSNQEPTYNAGQQNASFQPSNQLNLSSTQIPQMSAYTGNQEPTYNAGQQNASLQPSNEIRLSSVRIPLTPPYIGNSNDIIENWRIPLRRENVEDIITIVPGALPVDNIVMGDLIPSRLWAATEPQLEERLLRIATLDCYIHTLNHEQLSAYLYDLLVRYNNVTGPILEARVRTFDLALIRHLVTMDTNLRYPPLFCFSPALQQTCIFYGKIYRRHIRELVYSHFEY